MQRRNWQRQGLVWAWLGWLGCGYVFLYGWMPLPTYYLHSLGLHQFAPSLPAGFLYALLLSSLFIAYFQLYQLIQKQYWQPNLQQLLWLTGLLAIPLLFTYPFNANDLYRYVIQGRITAVYGDNPLLMPPAAYPAEPFLPLGGEWVHVTSPYGPVWELMAGFLASLVHNPLGSLVLFKAWAVLAHLLCGWLIGRKTTPGRAYLWLFNPALLLIFAGDGHNDGWMLLWLVMGWVVLDRPQLTPGRVALGWAVLCLAPLTKAVALLVLPLVAVWLWRRTNQPFTLIIVCTLTTFIITFIAFLPFGFSWQIVQRLLTEAGGGASFSAGATFLLWYKDKLGREITPLLIQFLAAGGFMTLGLFLLGAMSHIGCKNRPVLPFVATIFALYVLVALNFRLWYTSWPLPFVLLDKQSPPTRLHQALWFLFFGQLTPLVYGQLHLYWFNKAHYDTHLVGIIITFVCPLLMGWLTSWWQSYTHHHPNSPGSQAMSAG